MLDVANLITDAPGQNLDLARGDFRANPLAGHRETLSVIIPVRNSERTIRALVDSLKAQECSFRLEVIIVGDVGDLTWTSIQDHVESGFVRAIECEIQTHNRDANAKRNVGLLAASGDYVALTDSDMELPADWAMKGVSMLREGRDCVASSMEGATGNYWDFYVDKNPVLSKTPRMDIPYVIDQASFARGNCKPPITANMFVSRKLLERVGGLDEQFVHSYEDYEWARRIVDEGFEIYCDGSLAGLHHHRSSFRDLAREYFFAGRGCGDYVAKFPRCHLSKSRAMQVVVAWLAIVAACVLLVVAPAVELALAFVAFAAIGMTTAVKARRLSAAWFPGLTGVFASLFAFGLSLQLVLRMSHRLGLVELSPVKLVSYAAVRPGEVFEGVPTVGGADVL